MEFRGRPSKPGLDSIPEWFREAAGWLQSISARIVPPLLAVAVFAAVIDLTEPTKYQTGWLLLAMSAVYSTVYLRLRTCAAGLLTAGHAAVAIAALTGSLDFFFSDSSLLALLAAEALLLHLAASKLDDLAVTIPAHLVAVLAAGALINSLAVGYPAADVTVVFNAESLAQLAVLGMFVLVACLIADVELLPLAYRLAAHVGLLAWLARELGALPGGDGWVSAAWGVYALLLLVPGLIGGNGPLRICGLVTLFLTVGKLLLVDLSRVDPLWRILLFMAFGAVFLVLGYLLRDLWGYRSRQGNQNNIINGTTIESECKSQ
jgi:hypothetical protein